MSFLKICSATALAMSASALLLPAQESGKGLTARELFYTPPPAKAQVSATTAAKTATAATTTVRKTPVISSSNRIPKGTPPVTSVDTVTPVISAHTATAKTDSSAVTVIPVVRSSGIPLALRYSFLRQAGNGDYAEVDTDTVFHSGDKLKLQVKSNDRAYLYVASLGSSGNWTVLFPNPDIDNGNNIIERNQVYEVPGRDDRFTFDEQKGKEKVVLMLSRQPIENIDQVIYKINQTQPDTQPARVLSARVETPITGDLVDRLRAGVVARDLVFEKVNDEKRPPRRESNVPQTMEKAAYVANSRTDESARLIADVTLIHE